MSLRPCGVSRPVVKYRARFHKLSRESCDPVRCRPVSPLQQERPCCTCRPGKAGGSWMAIGKTLCPHETRIAVVWRKAASRCHAAQQAAFHAACLPLRLPAHLPAFPPTFCSAHVPTCLLSGPPIRLPAAHLPACLPTHLSARCFPDCHTVCLTADFFPSSPV